jgi:FAD/FMN-containing dehydrogenase
LTVLRRFLFRHAERGLVGEPDSGCVDGMTTADTPPPGFPPGIDVFRRTYENWSGHLRVDDVWTCEPRDPDDVVAVANWARQQGWTVRASGWRHGWSPLTVTPEAQPATTMAVDTTRHLTGMQLTAGASAAVQVQAGATMDDLMAFLQDAGLGMTHYPAAGHLTIGGVLAIGGHGTAVPAAGEATIPGTTFGSVSNLVVSLTAVVWDDGLNAYTLRTFDRADPGCSALLTQLGRSFITDVTLRVGNDSNLRCVSYTDIPASELFAAPGTTARTFAGFVDAAGRAEATWFVFTDRPWVKVWSVRPTRPLTSRPAIGPYNYPFSDNIPDTVSDLASQLIAGAWQLTPAFGAAQLAAVETGLIASLSRDIWGPSRYLLHYLKPTTLKVHANGYTITTSRSALQQLVHDIATYYANLVATYQAQNLYPVVGGIDFRVTGTDQPADVAVAGASPPDLSATRPHADHPEWDTVVWVDVVTLPTAPSAFAFLREMESYLFTNYPTTRVEWSKGWAYTTSAAWADTNVITQEVPESFRQGTDATWDTARTTLNGFDPHRVFTNPLLDELLP